MRFKYSYEYTNILDLFFPSLSNNDFFGLQTRFTIDPEKFGKPAAKEEPVLAISARLMSSPAPGSVEADVQEAGNFRPLPARIPRSRISANADLHGDPAEKE